MSGEVFSGDQVMSAISRRGGSPMSVLAISFSTICAKKFAPRSLANESQSASATSDRDRRWRGFASVRHLLPRVLRTVGGWWTNEHRAGRSRYVRCPLEQRPNAQRVQPESNPTRSGVLESSLQDDLVQRSWRGRSQNQCMWIYTSPASSGRPVSEGRERRITTRRSSPEGCAISARPIGRTRSISQ